MSQNLSKKLLKMILRVPKEHSAFTYFQLEANEGLCFYSTLSSSIGEGYRDISLIGSLEFKDEINHLIKKLREQYPIEVIKNEVVDDNPNLANIE